MTLDEILAALKAEVGDDKTKAKDVARALRTQIPALSQVLIDHGAGKGKGEKQAEVDRLTTRVAELEAETERVTGEFDAHKAKTPDVAAAIETERKKWEGRLKTATDDLTKARGDLTGEKKRVRVAKLSAALREKGVDPEYLVIAEQKYGDRIAIGEDGVTKILQLGEDSAYDAENEDAAIARLADDVKKAVPPRFILTTADSGAGTGSNNGHGGGAPLSGDDLIARKRASGMYRGVF